MRERRSAPKGNRTGAYGRWGLRRVTNVWAMQHDLAAEINAHFGRMIENAADAAPVVAG